MYGEITKLKRIGKISCYRKNENENTSNFIPF